MKIKIVKKKVVEEMSSMAGGSVTGYAAPLGFKKGVDTSKEKKAVEEELSTSKMDEMYSTAGSFQTGGKPNVTPEDEHAGHVERSKRQGLRNVMMEEKLGQEGSEAVKILDDKGYVAWDTISSGQYGTVFQAETEDGQGVAIKALWTKPGDEQNKIREVSLDDLKREIRNYKIIEKARGKDEAVEKHFPKVFETFIENDSSGKPIAFIVMEKLSPLEPEAKQLLPDPAFFAAMKGRALGVPAKKIRNRDGESQTLEKRGEMFFRNNDNFMNQLQSRLENLIPEEAKGEEIAKNAISNLRINHLMSKWDPIANSKYAMVAINDLLDKTRDPSLKNSNKQLRKMVEDYSDSKFVVLSILDVFNQFVKIIKTFNVQGSDFALEQMLKDLQSAIRQQTLTHGAYKRKQMSRPKETSGGKGVEAALMKIRPMTGLFPQDLHWGNFLQRDDGTIVVVDLGLFKNTSDFNKDKKKRETEKTISEGVTFKIKILR